MSVDVYYVCVRYMLRNAAVGTGSNEYIDLCVAWVPVPIVSPCKGIPAVEAPLSLTAAVSLSLLQC